MRFLDRLSQPLKGFQLLRRLLAEARGIRRALDRVADALELQSGQPSTLAGQVFRSYARTRGDLADRDLQDLTEVSYVDSRTLAGMLAVEDDLRAVLGRDPTEDEIMAAYEGKPGA